MIGWLVGWTCRVLGRFRSSKLPEFCGNLTLPRSTGQFSSLSLFLSRARSRASLYAETCAIPPPPALSLRASRRLVVVVVVVGQKRSRTVL